MGDVMIGAAPAGQQGAVSGSQGTGSVPSVPAAQQAGEPNQPQVSYVTSEQLQSALDRIERLVQSSTDKSYNRVQKMIDQMKQAGIQNPTMDQARAMLAATGQSEQQEQQPEAQPVKSAAASPEADAWIRANGGDVTQDYWNDIYDSAQEAGVGIITREDPEYEQYFVENGQPKQFARPRLLVRAFEQAFEAKRARLQQQGTGNPLASSPALNTGGGKSNYNDPKTTDRSDLIMAGLREQRRR